MNNLIRMVVCVCLGMALAAAPGLAQEQQQQGQKAMGKLFQEVPEDQAPAGNGSVIGAKKSPGIKKFLKGMNKTEGQAQPGEPAASPLRGLFNALTGGPTPQAEQAPDQPADQPPGPVDEPVQQAEPEPGPMTPEEEVQAALEEASEFADITYDYLSIDKANKRIEARGIAMVPTWAPEQKITIDEIVIVGLDLETDTFNEGSIKIANVRIPVTPQLTTQAYPFLSGMGYQAVVLSFEMSSEYDEAAQTFNLREAALDAQDMGRLSLSLALSNIKPEEMMGTMSPADAALSRAELVYADKSLVVRGMEMAAGMEEKSLEEFRQEGVDALEAEISEAREKGQTTAVAAMQQLQAFIRNPGVLRITVEPGDAVAFNSLLQTAGPDEAMELLQITVTAQ